MSTPIDTPRKDAVGTEIDRHREGCHECTHGRGCREGRRLWRRFLAAWDDDMEQAGLIHDHTTPDRAVDCRACIRERAS